MVNLMPRRCMLGRQGRTGPQLLMARTGYACVCATYYLSTPCGWVWEANAALGISRICVFLTGNCSRCNGWDWKVSPHEVQVAPARSTPIPPEMRVTFLRPTLTFKHSPLKAKTCHGTLRVVCRSNDKFRLQMFTAFVTNLHIYSLSI